ncbi:Elongator subunit elp2 [Neophaeococcomyces mojaviensis]|uniref:Elongator subunit elp2 n=1 Tax=Neophaeococcomyces mojaviensis TaxID=3383035 RepID=A0ACC2ZW79_9EURO|nr:Elongator subunit elp2 [Knufia sp. JES_112]
MSIAVESEYLSIGGNRNTAASAWCAEAGFLAYGADQNIAIWRPLAGHRHGVSQLLQGHDERVTAITKSQDANLIRLISGDAKGNLIIWSFDSSNNSWTQTSKINAHAGAVNTVTVVCRSNIVVSGGADATIKVWRTEKTNIEVLVTINPKPRFIPLALAAGSFPNLQVDEGFMLAAAGTRNEIFVYSISGLSQAAAATLACSLTGHEGWVRSLAMRKSGSDEYTLASTSHDKYVRLWRFSEGDTSLQTNSMTENEVASFEQTLTAKVRSVSVGDRKYFVTFEALLLGHEDWVYSADWQDTGEQKLLTTSADGTLTIWEPDPSSGIWVGETRLGEISGQKGATTATGSSGGFWAGKWVSDGKTTAVISLGRTGSWRIWELDPNTNFWELRPGVGGHVNSVNGLSWSPKGEYLLSTSSDQTTRLHAEWRRNGKRTWHEFSRCQIHGYDCNVVSSINSSQFASGADEKLLRVFDEPKELVDTLQQLCEITPPENQNLPETAAVPVLGLSNKAMGEPDDIIEAGPRRGDDEYAAASALAGLSIRGIKEPPTEDLLSRHTLWPEREKLYGHGYEISECAYSDGILATACKASSIDHATIRLYDAESNWREIKPPLTAHSLTVTRLSWSRNRFLLSVGRDRQWTVFRQPAGKTKQLELYQAMPKAHTRMILDAAWSPSDGLPFFATAGRDKTVKLWVLQDLNSQQLANAKEQSTIEPQFELFTTLTRPSAVTAISITCDADEHHAVLAVGEDDGTLSVHVLSTSDLKLQTSIELEKASCLRRTVNRLAWRPHWPKYMKDAKGVPLAVAGADGSVRILRIDIEALYSRPAKEEDKST